MQRVVLIGAWAIVTGTLHAQVLITEILFEPITERGSEFVEVFNAGAEPVALKGISIVDGTGRVQATVPSRAPALAPGSFAVIAASELLYVQFPALADSPHVVVIGKASFGLNASGDNVVLRTRSGAVLDSVTYSGNWHRPDLPDTRGTSLERISISSGSNDPRGWTSSVARAGGTPGTINSIALPPKIGDAAQLRVEPVTISPDGDGYQDFTRVSWELPRGGLWIMINVYDAHGRLIRRIANNEISGVAGEIVWDGCDEARRGLAPGVYVIRLEAHDRSRGVVLSTQEGVVVAPPRDN